MSHRITIETEIRDAEVAKKALDKAGLSYTEHRSTLSITSGALRGVNINLQTGTVSGDSDPGYGGHSTESMSTLKAYYAEQKYIKECQANGIQVEGREETDEYIILHVAVA